MNTDESSPNNESLLSGARFFRCALQVNPHGYKEQFRGQQAAGNEVSYAKAIVDKAKENDVSVLAITNHNDAKAVTVFQETACGQGITIFPGFELSSSEGIHILCLYGPETNDENLGRFLGEFGIRQTTASANLANKPFEEVLSVVRSQGGIGIAAHVTTNKGLFKVLPGQARINAWRAQDLRSIQIPGAITQLPKEILPIVKNQNPDYRRHRPAGENLAVAVVNARDVAEPAGLDHPAATCWIKMSEITIEGLRQAFLDPDSRIRLNSDPKPEDHAEILSLAWEAGFLDGVTIHFNPNLNVLVGGRGAGKSTVIESVRYALDQEPIGDESGRTHAGIVHQVLRPATKLSLRVRTLHPAPREYLVERTVPNPPVVRDENGQLSQLHPRDILSRVEILGQHEISELTRSPKKLTALLNRFRTPDDSLVQRKTSVQRDLAQTRHAILEVRNELQQVDYQLATLPALEETLVRYQEAGLEERLKARSLLIREERILDSVPERISIFQESLDLLRQELPLDLAFLSDKALAGLPGQSTLAEAVPVLEKLSRDLKQVALRFEEALKRAHQDMIAIRDRWELRKNDVEDEYRQILRELQKAAVDGEEFIRLRSKIEHLRPLRQQGTLLKQLEQEHTARRFALLTEWEEVKAAQFRLLDQAARFVNRRLRDRVKVEVTAGGDREPLYEALRSEIGGRLSETIDRLRQISDLSLPMFVQCCRNGAAKLQETYTLSLSQAERLANASPDSLMKLEELELLPTTEIQLNLAPVGETPVWQTLDHLSTGQKATAVLLLLLLDSEAPLIIDQPEDDLDNRFITDGVVPGIRKAKRQRQFIFSTHNANIPVLGDAELILGLTPAGEANQGSAEIKPEHVGSIDARPVRELVEEILEGGTDAFETRRLKYGF